jgi:hypothetical protein
MPCNIKNHIVGSKINFVHVVLLIEYIKFIFVFYADQSATLWSQQS